MVDLTPESLARKLAQAAAGVHAETLSAMKSAALDVEAEAKRNCTPGSSPYDGMTFASKVLEGVSKKKGTQIASHGGAYSEGSAIGSGAPYDTGLMRTCICSGVVDSGGKIQGTVGVFADGEFSENATSELGYCWDVHDGTSKMQARPFLWDAIIAMQSNTTKKLSDGVTKGITRALL